MDALTPMHNPPHPGEFITGVYLEPFGVTGRALAKHLGVAPSTLSRVLNGSNRVSPEMALRLSKALGRSAESWLAMQDAHDLWVARQSLDLERIEPLGLGAA
ncbi:HigA family addiction module antidote protein [Demequina sp. TTPB684]|uniref:HigA family addiction module antitoxin n=1 Tax=unclassified Demequina TaxID=2620311 RepID=UPI001CF1192A|nr:MULTISPECIES: HigA family addiction module antitoxin [unclassified Demequina]MCB2411687.1 HigA family addiction module antidote protein [Demequina sp. TTPB684]UPU88916.1 HigA family addiction module antitoxin [Demequina sp. TMPB413]